MMAHRKTLARLGLTLGFAALSGCAVLRIDVDVYKGPLANHEHVQLQQFAAMAIGAKPLLAELRNQVEWQEGVPPPPKMHCARPEFVFNNPEKYVGRCFEKDQAIRVNDVLGLYRDLGDPTIAKLIAKGQRDYADYLRAIEAIRLLEDGDTESDRCRAQASPPKTDGDAKTKEEATNTYTICGEKEKARKAMRQLWEGTIGALEYVTSDEFPKVVDRQEKLQLLGAEKQLIALIADLITIVIQPRHLAAVTARGQELALLAPGNKVLRDTFRLADRNDMWETVSKNWLGSDYNRANSSLRLAIIAQPEKMLRYLKKADAYLRQRRLSDAQLRLVGLLGKRLDEFGLARGPSLGRSDGGNGQSDKLESIPEAVAAILGTSGGGAFSAGRISRGIEGMVEDYLNASDEYRLGTCGDPENKCVAALVDRLRDGLIRFATKVLAVANNQVLLSVSDEKLPLGREKLDRYTLVLQAIGNSIVVQADELVSQSGNKRAREKNLGRESSALELAYLKEPRKILDDLGNFIKDQANSALSVDKGFVDTSAALKISLAELETELADKKTALKTLKDELDALKAQTAAAEGRCLEPTLALRLIQEPMAPGGKNPTTSGPCDPKLHTKTLSTPFHTEIGVLAANAGLANKLYGEIDTLFHQFLIGLQPAVAAVDKQEPMDDFAVLTKALSGYQRLPNNLVEKATTRADALKAIQKKLTQLSNIEKNRLGLAEMRVIIKQALLNPRANAVKNAAKAVKDKKKEIADKITEKQVSVAAAHCVLAKAREMVIAELSLNGHPMTTGKVLKQLESILEKAKTAPASPPDCDLKLKTSAKPTPAKGLSIEATEDFATAYKATYWKSAYYAPTGGTPAKTDKTDKDVLDDVIALLRQEHIRAVALHGKDSRRATDILAAIAAANEHRSGMIYIRPASVYLRSSLAASLLQTDPALRWKNMLAGHAARSTPFFGEPFTSFGDEKRLKILGQVDRQFWQNINSVRVAGAGRTNYAIAKDDIGNWYVKRYSSNPKDIIKGAQSLALFRLSGKLDTNLLARRDAQAAGEEAGQEDDVPTTTLEKFFLRFEKNYTDKTAADFKSLKDALDGETLQARIIKAWEGRAESAQFKSAIKTELDSASGQELKGETIDNLAAKADKPGEQPAAIVQALGAMKRFHNLLQLKIVEKNLGKETEDAVTEKTKAVSKAQIEKNATQATLDKAKLEKEAAVRKQNGQDEQNTTDDAKEQAKKDVEEAEQAVKNAQTNFDAANTKLENDNQALAAAKETHQKRLDAIVFVRSEATRVTRAAILAVIADRDKTADEFENSVIFLGEVSQPEAADPKKKKTTTTAGLPVDAGQ